MSFESDLFGSFPSESVDAFFAPPPQPLDAPSPEVFDKDVDKEVWELDLNWSFEPFDGFLSTFCNTVNPTPPALTYSTESGYESSQYSDNIPPLNSPLVYSTGSEVVTRVSENDGSYTMDNSIFSDAFFNDLIGVSPSDLSVQVSTVQQPVACAAPLPVHVLPDSAKPFKCPQCMFASARKYNLKKHVDEKHNGLKPFGCDSCGQQFSRKHDLRRHRTTMHGDRSSTSSVSTLSNRHFDLEYSLPQHHAAINGDQRPAMSARPDLSSDLHPAAVVPVDVLAWYRECAACLQDV